MIMVGGGELNPSQGVRVYGLGELGDGLMERGKRIRSGACRIEEYYMNMSRIL